MKSAQPLDRIARVLRRNMSQRTSTEVAI
jgi:hypothetical protein